MPQNHIETLLNCTTVAEIRAALPDLLAELRAEYSTYSQNPESAPDTLLDALSMGYALETSLAAHEET